MSETPTTKPSLFAKLALIAGAIEGAATDGFNPQLKYKYPTPATIFRAVKPHMAAHRVAIIPTLEGVERVESGRTGSGQAKYVTTVTMTYTVADGDSGEVLTIRWQGEGEDWSDKGIAKAQTIATRTFLTHLFQIPAGIEDDDPDSAAAPVAPEPPRARVVPAPRITKPSPQPQPEAQPRAHGDDTTITVEEAKQVFFANETVKKVGQNWSQVVRFMGYTDDLAVEPATVNDWRTVYIQVKDRLAQLQAQAEG